MNPSEENPKFRSLAETATNLFWRYGVSRVTIEEICREAEISKMTFYKFFKNKIDLAKYILGKKLDEGMTKYQEIMNSDIPFQLKIEKSIQLKMEQTENISAELIDDIYRNPYPELLEFFNEKKAEFLNRILVDYTDAQKSGHLRTDIKPEFMLYFLNHMFQLTKDTELNSLYNSPQELIMELTNFFFYGIMIRNENKQ